MYAIIETGGKQVKVKPGQTVRIEKLNAEENDTVNFSNVLLISDENGTKVGNPFIEGAEVTGKLVSQGKAKKIIVFKYKPKKNYKKKQGHRQPFSEVLIETIKG